MFLLGHTGIGGALGRRFVAPRAFRWLVLGTLVPDLVDKPLYYGLVLATSRRGANLGLVSGTRTFGHTAILLIAVFIVLRLARRRDAALAVALGMATHLALDLVGDLFAVPRPPGAGLPPGGGPPTIAAVLFPLLGARFPVMPWRDAAEHAGTLAGPWVLGGEIIGALIWLSWLWRYRRSTRRHRART